MATRKTSTTKKTATKKVVEQKAEAAEEVAKTEEVKEAEEVVETEEVKEEPKKEIKVYKDDDSIECRSITIGELIYIGVKSGEKYVFSNIDDTCEIEVRDLNSLKAKKSGYLYEPLFVIEDDEFMEQPKWADLKAIYDEVKANDVEEILAKPANEFVRILNNLPEGYKKLVRDAVADRIQNDDFDSIKKIKAVDEACGSDLYCLIK